MSQATTGAPQRLIASIAAAAGSRGAPEKPVPKIASTTGAGAGQPARRGPAGDAVGPRAAADVDLEAELAQQARRDQAVAAVVALAAEDPHGALGRQAGNRLGQRLPAASISSREGTPCSSIAQRSTARIPSASKSGSSQGSTKPA